ncbi:MAG: zinc-dependent metalloprotease [Candidatus Nanopelagicales bacterium]
MSNDVVDWDLAVSVGRRLTPGGPELSTDDTYAAVSDLRALARSAVAPVRERTGLVAESDDALAVVVDRATWLASNVDGFRVVLEPMLERLRGKKDSSPVTMAVGSRATAVQLGTVLAYLSGKVLGQFEAFTTTGDRGRLLLVAPNIVATERALGVNPHDFRLWVCLHEETHRVQFGAVPWLTEHLVSQIHSYLELTQNDGAELARRVVAALVASARGGSGTSLIDAAQSPAQKVAFDRITALMSLLEGHADYVMDAVGPEIVPSVATIRARFDARRGSHVGLDGLLRRLLGLDAKMAQYADGAAFVRSVVDRVGIDGFNTVWRSPADLPSRDEVAAPDSWCARVLDA